MAAEDRRIEVPDAGLDTPHGRLYRPLSDGRQIGVFALAFFAGPAIGFAVGAVPGDLSDAAHTLVQAPFVLIFFVGYAVWVSRLSAIAFEGMGRSLLKAFLTLVILRRKPRSIDDVLPSRERLLQMAVSAQKAGASFAPVSWPIGVLFGAWAMLFDSEMGAAARFLLVATSSIGWGYLLARLGRRGWLPFMEEG